MRKRLEPGDRYEDLVKEGLKLFSKQSLHSLSAAQIADHCGISKGLLFHYFEDKSGFYVEVLRRASQDLMLLTKKSEHLGGRERLVGVISDYLDWVEKHPRIYQMLINSDLGAHPKVRKIHDKKRIHYQTVVLNALFPSEPVTPERLYNFVGASSYVEGAVLHWINSSDLQRMPFQSLLLDGIRRIILS